MEWMLLTIKGCLMDVVNLEVNQKYDKLIKSIISKWLTRTLSMICFIFTRETLQQSVGTQTSGHVDGNNNSRRKFCQNTRTNFCF